MIDTGASRRISFLTSDELWTEWQGSPRALLTPDEIDAESHYNFFYGMPVHHFAGIYWGFLWVFRMNDPIHTELVTSRDGIHWRRSPKRVPLIPLGEEGAWDDGMTFGGPHWIEVGDQGWFYYAGHDGGAGCPGSKFVLVPLSGPVTYCFYVENTGDRPGREVVQLYLTDLEADVLRRAIELPTASLADLTEKGALALTTYDLLLRSTEDLASFEAFHAGLIQSLAPMTAASAIGLPFRHASAISNISSITRRLVRT